MIDPKNEDLIAYLYGELSDEENAKMESWLKEHPETLKELEELKSVRKVMGQVSDKEVIDPFFYSGRSTGTVWQISRIITNSLIKPAIGLAAAISFLILVGYFTALKVSTQSGNLSVTFGKEEIPSEQFDPTQVEQVVQKILDNQNYLSKSDLKEIEEGFKAELVTFKEDQNDQIRKAINDVGGTNNEAIAGVVKQIQQDNLEYLERYLEISSKSQERYIQATLTEFSNFLTAQREADLERIQYNLTNLKETQDQQKLETDQILTAILNTVNYENKN